jgi:hypothetical protein
MIKTAKKENGLIYTLIFIHTYPQKFTHDS